MDFSFSNGRILARGELRDGDASKFVALVSTLPDAGFGSPDAVVSLSSPGGSLFEGMRLGMAIRDAGVPTLVEAGEVCASACAIAFLGGQATGVTNDAIWREIEAGATLGYHGFFAAQDEVQIQNETLNEARVVNALIFEYASRMGGIDIGLLSRLLNVPPAQIEAIDTPRELEGLSIRLAGDPPKPPKGWARAACRNTVATILGHLDPIGIDDRLVGDPEPMQSLGAFRSRLLDDKYPAGDGHDVIRDAVAAMKPAEGIDLLAGQALYADGPKIGVWRQDLERGAGFYYDVCYAVTDFTQIRTVIVEGLGPTAITNVSDTLAGFAPDQPLW